MSCYGCICNHCANNVDSDHLPDEIEYFCYNCDDCDAFERWTDNCLMNKETKLHIERQAQKRRKMMHLVKP